MQTRRQTLGGVLRPGGNGNPPPEQTSRRTSLGDYYSKRFGAAQPPSNNGDATFPNNGDESNATASIPRQPVQQRKVTSIQRPTRRFDENQEPPPPLRSARKVRPTIGGYQDDLGGVGGSSRPSMMMVAQDRRDFSSNEGKSLGIRRVIEFLSSRSYGHALSEQELNSPTVTAFKQLLFSILSLLDLETAQNLRIKSKEKGTNWETTVVGLFRQIKYPYTLSPKQINAVGSANAWPKFLGALVWLCDLVDVGEVEIESQLFNAERNALMNDLTNAYFNYMDGDDSALDHVMGKLAQSVDLQMKQVVKRLEDNRAKISELEHTYLRLKEPPTAAAGGEDDMSFGESLSALARQLESLASDRMQMEKNLPVWRTKAANAALALQGSTGKLQELQQVKDSTEDKRRQEEEKMNSQVVKNADLSRLSAERANVERLLGETEKEHAELSRQNWTVSESNESEQVQVDAKRQDLVSRLKQLSTLNHMPIGNKLFDLSERQVEFATCELFLKECHNRLMARVSKARNESLDLKGQSDQNLEQSQQVETRVARLQMETQRWEDKHVQVERDTAAELEALQREIDLEREVKLQFEQGSQCLQEENEVRRLRMELDAKRQEWFRESAALDERIRNALVPVVGTKERLELIIQPAVACLQRCEEDISSTARQHLEHLQHVAAANRSF
ncbi:hypothetical protein BASA81_006661 [Batrachochytrium salamandrivorans]|nr:hypothetical protein BASA81_006661 [Batrachochytrium salamandrivorans]